MERRQPKLKLLRAIMGQRQSKDKLLFQQVSNGNTEGIKALCREGANLEWTDKEGKTPLIAACLNSAPLRVVETLLELGANPNAYRPGPSGGTPLHHAAKRGLEHAVKLLISYGANALVMNDDCETPLEVARAKGYTNIVRAIENHICLFSGWLREIYSPGVFDSVGLWLSTTKVWVVILPSGSCNPTNTYELELAIYASLQDARPRNVVALWKATLEEPNFNKIDPSVIILYDSAKTRLKLASATEGDKQQLRNFCDACKGIRQVNPAILNNSQTPVAQFTAPPDAENLNLDRAINASIHSAMAEASVFNPQPDSGASGSTGWNNSGNASSRSGLVTPAAPARRGSGSQWAMNEGSSGGTSSQQTQIQNNNTPTTQTMTRAPYAIPSAPPVADEIVEDGPIQYPSIDLGPVDIHSSTASSSCVICLDAPVQGACLPCGHMCGCMSCLNEIKAKKWGCPVCRAKINEVKRLYVV